ncbi:ABC transporter substrate-binding protein [Aureimonas psammosilenae]|uniref:ABC transporter substrate-binding protein n=1 Tax=Aureimonas psammosilenae TaxID=2495496 RepID=UPI001260A737|nr:ABC transporter substrate-binding protein [Aureimonas psammosilenae]
MTSRRHILAGLTAAFIGLGTALPQASAAETVRIGWLRGPNDITLAKARGSLEKALAEKGVTVEWSGPFPAAAPAFEALNAGAIDITAGSSTSAVAALAARVPLAIFGYQKMAPASEGIVAKPESGIASLRDLKGRKVVVNRGGTGEYLLVRGLETAGVDVGSVERVYLSPSDSGPSFVQNHVDAWATWDPFLEIAQVTYGGRVIADGAAIGSDNAVVLVASRDFADKHRDTLQAVFDVLKSDNAWGVANREEAGAIWAKEMGLPAALGPAVGAHNAVPTTPVGEGDIAEIDRIAGWYAANRIIPAKPDIAAGTVSLR